MNKALFLDRDGIINEDRHYPHLPEEIVFIPAVFSLCKSALQSGYIIIVVTNQAGVAKGYFPEQDVVTLHEWMKQQFAKENITVTAFYYCPFHKNGTVAAYTKDSEFRKPNPGMFLLAAQEHNVDLSQSIMIGDKNSDRIKNIPLTSYIIKSQYANDGYDFESLTQAEETLF